MCVRSGSVLHLGRTDKTGVVSVGELSHEVRLRLHSKEDGKAEERGKKGRSNMNFNHSFWAVAGSLS